MSRNRLVRLPIPTLMSGISLDRSLTARLKRSKNITSDATRAGKLCSEESRFAPHSRNRPGSLTKERRHRCCDNQSNAAHGGLRLLRPPSLSLRSDFGSFRLRRNRLLQLPRLVGLLSQHEEPRPRLLFQQQRPIKL